METNCQQNKEPCTNFVCSHNVYTNELKLKSKVQTEKAASISNCLLKNSGTTWTLEEIGNAWGMSRERIRQIEERSIEKIRSRGIKKLYEDYMP